MHCSIILAALLITVPHIAFAQAPPASLTTVEAAKPVVPMEDAKSGDRWVYDTRDEITGESKGTRIHVVTEVTPTEIATRFTNPQMVAGLPAQYDRSWNAIGNGVWKYSPHDGTGINAPLAVGKTWSTKGTDLDTSKGHIWRRTVVSKVVGRENVTTKAGTFDTYRIETKVTARFEKDGRFKATIEQMTWYAPAINHLVKQTMTFRANERMTNKETVELVAYGRKP